MAAGTPDPSNDWWSLPGIPRPNTSRTPSSRRTPSSVSMAGDRPGEELVRHVQLDARARRGGAGGQAVEQGVVVVRDGHDGDAVAGAGAVPFPAEAGAVGGQQAEVLAGVGKHRGHALTREQ